MSEDVPVVLFPVVLQATRSSTPVEPFAGLQASQRLVGYHNVSSDAAIGLGLWEESDKEGTYPLGEVDGRPLTGFNDTQIGPSEGEGLARPEPAQEEHEVGESCRRKFSS